MLICLHYLCSHSRGSYITTDVKLDYAWLQMDKQKASSGKMYNFMKDNYGHGKINVFMNGEAAFTTELALHKVENDEIIAKYISGN